MRALAMRLTGDDKGTREKLLVDDWPDVGEPEGNQVKIRALFSGITNGTERNGLLRGNYAPRDEQLPSAYGYQHVGEVVAVGADAVHLEPGDTVFSSSHHTEYVLVAEDGLLTKLPDEVEPRHAALFGMAGVAMHDVRRADTELADNVLVVGAGPIGQFTAQAARAAGAVVTIVDLSSERLLAAEKCAADRTIRIVDDDSWQTVHDAGPFDIVFEDSGAPVLDRIIGRTWGDPLVKRRGRIVMIAGRDEVTYAFNPAQGSEITILHAGHFNRNDLEQVARLTVKGIIRVEPIIQDMIPVAAAKGIYARLRDDPQSLFGTVFEW